MAHDDRKAFLQLADRWQREAFGYEQRIRRGDVESTLEKRLLEMHARIKHGCADELRREAQKVRRE